VVGCRVTPSPITSILFEQAKESRNCRVGGAFVEVTQIGTYRSTRLTVKYLYFQWFQHVGCPFWEKLVIGLGWHSSTLITSLGITVCLKNGNQMDKLDRWNRQRLLTAPVPPLHVVSPTTGMGVVS